MTIAISRTATREEKIAALREALNGSIGDAVHNFEVGDVLDDLYVAGFDVQFRQPPIEMRWGTFCGPWEPGDWRRLPTKLKIRWWQETKYSQQAPTEELCDAVATALKEKTR